LLFFQAGGDCFAMVGETLQIRFCWSCIQSGPSDKKILIVDLHCWEWGPWCL